MSRFVCRAIATVLLLCLAQAASAEIKVVAERIPVDRASAAFKFQNVPTPSSTDAGTNARLSIIAGQGDPNGADPDVLVDGRLPDTADQPDANFFFNANTPGGRLLIDLGRVTQIRRISTYSWHPGPRGPQVYKLYASDGSAEGFQAALPRNADPAESGYKLIVSVDTRPEGQEVGGQYAVSIVDSAGAALGSYRYLLVDVSATRPGDRFSNTFFCEIDIDDGQVHAARPAGSGITIDYSETPELKDWVENRLRPTLEKWYPIIVQMLPSEGYKAPTRFSVTFKKEMNGVAYTAGTRVVCAGPWFKQNLDGEAVGAVVHELVHVVQQYGRTRGNRNPGWLVEGVADYIRWFRYEPEHLRPRPNLARAKYTDSYRTTAAFLNWLMEKHDNQLIRKLNAAMREGKYRPELWQELTGKTVDELWADYVAAGGKT